MCLCLQNDRFILNRKSTVRSITQDWLNISRQPRFLYYLSVYVNLSKNSYLFCLEEVRDPQSGCKGTTIF